MRVDNPRLGPFSHDINQLNTYCLMRGCLRIGEHPYGAGPDVFARLLRRVETNVRRNTAKAVADPLR